MVLAQKKLLLLTLHHRFFFFYYKVVNQEASTMQFMQNFQFTYLFICQSVSISTSQQEELKVMSITEDVHKIIITANWHSELRLSSCS